MKALIVGGTGPWAIPRLVLLFAALSPRILYQCLALHIVTGAGVYHYHIF
jgi:hypothetical protein